MLPTMHFFLDNIGIFNGGANTCQPPYGQRLQISLAGVWLRICHDFILVWLVLLEKAVTLCLHVENRLE